MAYAHPAGEQCTAKAKATGERCGRRVIGGGVCWVHGGAARQVKQAREQRVAVAEARAAAAAEPVVLTRREPEEVLVDLLDDVSRILAQIKSELHGNVVSPALLQVCGEWMDRMARVAKVITDGDLSEKLHRRLGWMAEDRGSQLVAGLAAVLQAAPLTSQQRLAVWESRFDGWQAIRDGRLPLRMLGEATADFTEQLQVEAAREREAVEGFTWDDSDSAGEPSGNGSGVR